MRKSHTTYFYIIQKTKNHKEGQIPCDSFRYTVNM